MTPRPSGLARKTAVSATSAGSVLRRSGALAATCSKMMERPGMPRADAGPRANQRLVALVAILDAHARDDQRDVAIVGRLRRGPGKLGPDA